MGPIGRRAGRHPRCRAGPSPSAAGVGPSRRAPDRPPREGPYRLRQHDPGQRRAHLPWRRGHRAPHPPLHPLERGGDGSPGPTVASRASAGTRPPVRRPPRSTRSGSTHFFRGEADNAHGDQVFIQRHASPGIYARAFLEGRLGDADLDRCRRRSGAGRPATHTLAGRTSGSSRRCRWASA